VVSNYLKTQVKKWTTIADFSRRVNKTPQYINQCIREGKISKKSLKQHGKRYVINSETAYEDLQKNTSYINKHPVNDEAVDKINKAGTKGMSLADAQKIQAQYKAALLKLEYEEKSGALVPLAQVETDFFNIARMTRDAILNIPGRISAELASITDVHSISEKLTTELTEALEELSL
jgi:hypothetical protein